LTEDGHVGETYELTGPRLLTFTDAVAEIARATRREIRYVPVSNEDFAARLEEQAVPGEWIELLVYLFQEVLDARNTHLCGRRAAGPRPGAEGLRRLRARRRRHRRLDSSRRPGVAKAEGPGARAGPLRYAARRCCASGAWPARG
jgi:hypothetical protein